jgi:hypothetical protein
VNIRERFLAFMDFQPVRTLKWEFGYWVGAVRRWYEEGLPKTYPPPEGMGEADNWRGSGMGWRDEIDRDYDVNQHFDMDSGVRRVKVNHYFCPAFEPEVLEDHGDWVLEREANGIIQRRLKDTSSLPSLVHGPVQTRDDWERLKAERLNPSLEGRLPNNWEEVAEAHRNRTYPLAVMGMQGFFGTPRNLLGAEQVLYALHDSPELIEDMNSYMCDFWMAIYEPIVRDLKPDWVQMWEDMSYRSGMLISPEHFRRFMMPYYRKLTGFFRDLGVKHVTVDSDGDCWELIPLLMEGGVTGLLPMEVQAGMDIVKVREAFPRFQMMGGMDKRALAQGEEAIDAELEAKLPQVLERGGCIPYVDHLVPSNVSFANFSHYRWRLNEMIDTYGQAG